MKIYRPKKSSSWCSDYIGNGSLVHFRNQNLDHCCEIWSSNVSNLFKKCRGVTCQDFQKRSAQASLALENNCCDKSLISQSEQNSFQVLIWACFQISNSWDFSKEVEFPMKPNNCKVLRVKANNFHKCVWNLRPQHSGLFPKNSFHPKTFRAQRDS